MRRSRGQEGQENEKEVGKAKVPWSLKKADDAKGRKLQLQN